MRLHLVVNVLDQCKEGVCFPEDESLWSQAELVRIVSLSGIAGTMLPSNYGYAHEDLHRTSSIPFARCVT